MAHMPGDGLDDVRRLASLFCFCGEPTAERMEVDVRLALIGVRLLINAEALPVAREGLRCGSLAGPAGGKGRLARLRVAP